MKKNYSCLFGAVVPIILMWWKEQVFPVLCVDVLIVSGHRSHGGKHGLNLFNFKLKRANLSWKKQKHKLKASESSGKDTY